MLKREIEKERDAIAAQMVGTLALTAVGLCARIVRAVGALKSEKAGISEIERMKVVVNRLFEIVETLEGGSE